MTSFSCPANVMFSIYFFSSFPLFFFLCTIRHTVCVRFFFFFFFFTCRTSVLFLEEKEEDEVKKEKERFKDALPDNFFLFLRRKKETSRSI